MKNLFPLCFLILLFGCDNIKRSNSEEVESKTTHTSQEQASENASSTYYRTDCNTPPISEDFEIIKNSKNIRTFTAKSFLYCSPNVNAKIIDSIPFNTKLVVIETININKSTEDWLKVSYKTQQGYINRPVDIEHIEERGNLLLVKSILGAISIQSFDKVNPNVIIDTYHFPFSTVTSRVYDFFYNGLDKTDIVIKYQGTSQRLGFEKLINVTPTGKINEIVNGHYENDWEYSTWEKFYYPLTFGNGRTLLVLNADHENVFNLNTAELNIFPYPKGIDVPINQLIIKIKGLDNPELDEDGKIITDDGTEDGMPILQVAELDTIYYKWTGEKLLKVK